MVHLPMCKGSQRFTCHAYLLQYNRCQFSILNELQTEYERASFETSQTQSEQAHTVI